MSGRLMKSTADITNKSMPSRPGKRPGERNCMKFYFYDRSGKAREMDMEEVREHLSVNQIEDAIAAKIADPQEEVSYMTVGGYIAVEF